jgi:hypothetical protein
MKCKETTDAQFGASSSICNFIGEFQKQYMKLNSYFEKLSERQMSIAEGRNLKYLNEDLIAYCKGKLNSPWP